LPAGARGCLFNTGCEAMNEPKAQTGGHGRNGGQLIYVVDDEPMLLELASVILEPLGYSVKTFSSPESALSAFESAEPRPALIITDYAMHKMNGLELAAACRRIRPEQKVLLVSGTVGPDIFHGAPVTPVAFLAKPYQSRQLIDGVATILAS
jgi:two-component system, cell cycle sensor histidine kinase and response regulator CckA